jgi:2-polyprenyl-3-methyl-5-hydroxy-6-metoxy-1,4-benzoquinol methylase
VQGVEYSTSAASIAKKLHLSVTEGEIFDVRKNNYYAVVTLWDVIEHVKNPQRVLIETNRKLKEGGFVFISTGDVSRAIPKISLKYWYLMTPPMHLFFFL